MRIQKTYWIEPEIDFKLIGRIQKYGQRKLSKNTNINEPTISRWLHCGVGMREDWYKRIMKALSGTYFSGSPTDICRHEDMIYIFHTVKRRFLAGIRS